MEQQQSHHRCLSSRLAASTSPGAPTSNGVSPTEEHSNEKGRVLESRHVSFECHMTRATQAPKTRGPSTTGRTSASLGLSSQLILFMVPTFDVYSSNPDTWASAVRTVGEFETPFLSQYEYCNVKSNPHGLRKKDI